MQLSVRYDNRVKVYLDDERVAPEGWVQTRTPANTIALLETQCVSHLSLDHDLGDDDGIGTGNDVVLWLEQRVHEDRYFIAPETITVHSANPPAHTKMQAGIDSIKRRNGENFRWCIEENG